jgi:methyl-accepting chemotaxis protein
MKNLKIGTRLAAGFGLVLALMILMTAIGIRHMGTVAGHARHDAAAAGQGTHDFGLVSPDPHQRAPHVGDFEELGSVAGPVLCRRDGSSTAEVNGLQKKVEPLLESDEEKAIFTGMMDNRKRYLASRDAIVALKKEASSRRRPRCWTSASRRTARLTWFAERLAGLAAQEHRRQCRAH